MGGTVGGNWGAIPTPQAAPSQHEESESRLDAPRGSTGNIYGGNSYDNDARRSSDGGRPSYGNDNAGGRFSSSARNNRSTGRTTSGPDMSGSYERQAISSLCAPGGMRAVP